MQCTLHISFKLYVHNWFGNQSVVIRVILDAVPSWHVRNIFFDSSDLRFAVGSSREHNQYWKTEQHDISQK